MIKGKKYKILTFNNTREHIGKPTIHGVYTFIKAYKHFLLFEKNGVKECFLNNNAVTKCEVISC